MSGTIKVTLSQGLPGSLHKHRKIVHSLGLRKLGQVKELKDIPEVRGQIKKVEYMVSIVD
jgi:large subunit ribosomal protein L30